MSVQDMRAELKVLRSEHPDFMPVSKMKKADISSLLEKMKQSTATTPATALTKGEKMGPAKGEVEKVVKAKADKVEKVAKVEKADTKEKEKVKETMKERMARIRELRKKKE